MHCIRNIDSHITYSDRYTDRYLRVVVDMKYHLLQSRPVFTPETDVTTPATTNTTLIP